VVHAIVALKGERESVRTFEMTIGVVGTGAVVVVGSVGAVPPVVVVGGLFGLAATANVRGTVLKVTTSPLGEAACATAAGFDAKRDRVAVAPSACRPGRCSSGASCRCRTFQYTSCGGSAACGAR
jgi:hypothetical protein